jgi:hypothetical protein
MDDERGGHVRVVGTPQAEPAAPSDEYVMHRQFTVTTPQPGQRVRVTIEGEVADATPHGFNVVTAGGAIDFHLGLAPTVELLPDPQPAWWPPQPGDVIRWQHSVYLREQELGEDDPHQKAGLARLWTNAAGARMDDNQVRRAAQAGDVALLVRGGKPYQEEKQEPATAAQLAERPDSGQSETSDEVTVNRHDLAFTLRSSVRLGPGDWQRLLDADKAGNASPLSRLVVAAHADD